MGRKSSSKGQFTPPPARPAAERTSRWLPGAVAVALVAGVALAFWGGSDSTGSGAAATDAAGDAAQAAQVQVDEATIAKAAATAEFGPHTQANLPPIPFQGYAPPRPREVVTAAYHFAAEHPEVLSYVPCFCGCERSGHDGNHDCFVRQRDENGDVVAWDEHGVECAVCIDVATRSRQMHASGASVGDIRTAIDKEFGPLSTMETPTPHPPGHSH